jgi:DNA recombination protein RmuC
MDRTTVFIFGQPYQATNVVIAALAAGLLLLLILVMAVWRASRAQALGAAAAAERERELDEKLAESARLQAELTGRLQTIGEVLTNRQSDLARLVTERLDVVGNRVGQGLEASARSTTDQLSKLGERLAVIDSAQARLTGLTEEVVGLKDILANKQARGAFGQGRMEAIVRDGLPSSAFEFQFTLSNRNRPDCIVRLPGDDRVMIVDAKFPLEAFNALKNGADDEVRQIAAQRVRQDVARHIRDMAERYFIPGETQDLAILFVPSESIYADLIEHFEDVIQKAHRARIILVSPSLLMMAIQVLQALVRDARVREQAHLIQTEVRKLLDDVRRLRERTGKLDGHFRQVQEDVVQITTSADKIIARGDRIDQLDFAPGEKAATSAPVSRTGLVDAAE